MIGDPVSHSKSPAIHSHLLEIAGLSGTYEAVTTKEQDLEAILGDVRAGRWDGINVTMPLKEAAARLVDELAGVAQACASVNTVVPKGARLTGHTTDADAFQQILSLAEFSSGKAVLILGAGGSARAVMAAVPEHMTAYISARDPVKARSLAGEGPVVSWGTAVAGAIVVNCTPIGMRGEHLPDSVLRPAAGLIDLPYGDRLSPSVEMMRSMDVPNADGREFLLRQALASFRLWTGVAIEYEQVEPALRNV